MVASTSIDSEIVELISQSLEQPLTDKQVNPRIVFLTVLATALLGVVHADKEVTEQEKQRLQQTLKQFMPEGSSIGQLVRQLIQGIQKQKLYLQGSFVSKLTETLSESEKLLILCFSYETAKADGEIASQEQQYIQKFSKILKLEPTHVEIVQTLWNESGSESNFEVLDELHSLLDPHRFQPIDPVFAQAASYICDKFPKPAKIQNAQASSIAYTGLDKFQQVRKQLDELCLDLQYWIKEFGDHFALPQTLEHDLSKLSQSLQSEKFRLAIVGEFSQGKSTLLNALLGEEIQPVRTIPCSGTITVLRHGDSLRVLCKYKDGREEQIPYESYQKLASIPEEAALCNLGSELANFEVKEIILEHPDLTLCRHGVEIIDSPGLNEHPDRTTITQKLLKETDAVICLVNAFRPLTQGERELLEDLRHQLNYGRVNQPAANLFVLVNFMDLLRREKDKQQVRQLVTNFVLGSNPIIAQDNRLHFISAQAALDALLENTNDDYVEALQQFTSSLEHFLTYERGSVIIKNAVDVIHSVFEECNLSLEQAEHILDGEIKLSELERKQVINNIGEASGRDIRIVEKADEVYEQLIDQIAKSWEEWANEIEERIAEKSAHWKSESNDKHKILSDYSKQFLRDISTDLDDWMDKQVRQIILKPQLELLDDYILEEVASIRTKLEDIDNNSGSSLSKQFIVSLSNLGIDLRFDSLLNTDELGFNTSKIIGLGSGTSGFLGVFALSFLGFGLLPILLAGGITGLMAGWFFGAGEGEAEQKMKQQVFDKGFEKLIASMEQIFERVCEKVAEEVYARAKTGNAAIKSSIEILDTLLEQVGEGRQEAKTQKTAIARYRANLLLIAHKINSLKIS